VSASLQTAEKHLKEALAILDSLQAPADIGAHIDRAVHRIRELTGSRGSVPGRAQTGNTPGDTAEK